MNPEERCSRPGCMRAGRDEVRAGTDFVHWYEISVLYGRLVDRYPTTRARVGMAIAVAHAEGFERGLRLLEAIPSESVTNYQPYWVALAHVHEALGEREQAARGVRRALGLTTNPRVRRFLERRKTMASRESSAPAPTQSPKDCHGSDDDVA